MIQNAKYLVYVLVLTILMKNVLFQASLFLLSILFFILIFKNEKFRQNIFELPHTKVIISLLLAITVSNIFAINFIKAWSYQFQIVQLLLLFYLLLFLISIKSIKYNDLYFIFYISVAIQVVDAVIQYFYGVDIIGRALVDGRVTAMTFNQNILGMFLSLGFIVVLDSIVHSHRMVYLKLGFFMILLWVMFETLCRSSLLAAFLGGFLYLVYSRKNLKKNQIIVLLIACLIVIASMFFNDDVMNRILYTLDGNTSGRLESIWPKSLEYIKESPIIGYGLDGFRVLNSNEVIPFAMPHNMILEILISTGIIGLVIMMIIWVDIFKQINMIFSLDKRAFALLQSLFIVLFINGLFDHSIFQSIIYSTLWIFLASVVYSYQNNFDYK